jgi:glutamyl-tRNA reductase
VRRLENESYDAWVERVRLFEHGHALRRIAKGDNHETIVEEMSIRMMDKLMHPLYKVIRDSSKSNFDMEESKRNYYEHYLKTNSAKSDHVLND